MVELIETRCCCCSNFDNVAVLGTGLTTNVWAHNLRWKCLLREWNSSVELIRTRVCHCLMSFEFILLRLEIVIRDWISKFEIQIELDLETGVDHLRVEVPDSNVDVSSILEPRT